MVSRETHEWALQLASDIQRDGMGLELISPDGVLAAEAFRSDAEKTVHIDRHLSDIPPSVWDWFMSQIAPQLLEFEDGTSLPSPAAWRGL